MNTVLVLRLCFGIIGLLILAFFQPFDLQHLRLTDPYFLGFIVALVVGTFLQTRPEKTVALHIATFAAIVAVAWLFQKVIFPPAYSERYGLIIVIGTIVLTAVKWYMRSHAHSEQNH